MSVRPLVISGPSGAGKSTMMTELMVRNPNCFEFCVSHTTRSRRPNEKEGFHYYFISKEEFELKINESDFIEHVQFAGNYYGTSKKAVEAIINSGKICILDVEVNGVRSIFDAKLEPQPRFVFIYPSKIEELRKRLEARGTESMDKINQRVARAQQDIDFALQGGGLKIYNEFIKNDNLEDAVKDLEKLLKKDLEKISH